MRLRLVPVIKRVCADCGDDFEGRRCPGPCCLQPFDPARSRCRLKDCLILVGTPVPIYRPEKWCTCPECGNLYDPKPEILARALCRSCKDPFFDEANFCRLWQNTPTNLVRARKLEQALGAVARCRCGQPIAPFCWCPLCRSGGGTARGLPQRETVVWVRTFAQRSESLSELDTEEECEDD